MKKSLKPVSSTKLDRHYYQQCSYSKIWQDKQSQPDNTCKWKSIRVITSLQQIPWTGKSKIQGAEKSDDEKTPLRWKYASICWMVWWGGGCRLRKRKVKWKYVRNTYLNENISASTLMFNVTFLFLLKQKSSGFSIKHPFAVFRLSYHLFQTSHLYIKS